MDEEFVPVHREGSAEEGGFCLEDVDSEEVMGEDTLDLRHGGCDRGLEEVNNWGSLPNVCLQHVFTFLHDHDRMSADMVCHHWHNVMRSPALWRSRLFHFSGRLSRFRQSEHSYAVTYARYLGVYLERLEVFVCPPRKSLVAQRLARTISGLFTELTRVRAPLRSLSLVRLELDRSAWTFGLRSSLVNSLILFLHRGASKLTSVHLRGMRNSMQQGLMLLHALSHCQRRFYSQCRLSSLHLVGFFSGSVHAHLNSSVPSVLLHLRGLTNLSLSYSCLSDELLTALQHRLGGQWQNSSRDGSPLQTFSLHCTLDEPHQQVVSGDSWAALASSCPDLKVKLTVDQVIKPHHLARILLREIPLAEYSMTAFYSPNEDWSATALLCNMLPHYRRSLQYLTLDLSNCNESLDEELLELVEVCERLEELRLWAFLDIRTVEKLLQIRLTRRSLLNMIRVRIYSTNNTGEQEDQLEEMLSSYPILPPELKFFAIIYPFV